MTTIRDVKFGPENCLDGIIAFKNENDLEDVIIFLHGFLTDCRGNENKARVKIYSEKATEYGFYGVTFSFRGHGRSKNYEGKRGFISKTQLIEDIGSAINFVKNELYKEIELKSKPKTISLCGSSTGATGALYYIAENPGIISSLILISPYTTFDNVNLPKKLRDAFEKYYEDYKKTGVDANLPYVRTDKPDESKSKEFPASTYYWLNHMNGIEIAKKINIPTLVLCGINDGWINADSIKELYKSLGSEIKELREYDDGHSLDNHESEVIGDTFGFLRKIIKEERKN